FACILGILKTGAAYVPLEPAHPRARLLELVREAGCALAIADPARADEIGALPSHVLRGGSAGTTPRVRRGQLAYVLFTSGSTGSPKGVMIPHGALSNYLGWAVEAYRAHEGCGAPVHSSLAFDLTITSMFVPLLAGKPAICVDDDGGIDGLVQLLARESDF